MTDPITKLELVPEPDEDQLHEQLLTVAELARASSSSAINTKAIRAWYDKDVAGFSSCVVLLPMMQSRKPGRMRTMIDLGKFNLWLQGG
jgi:hypothetical protein